MNVNELRQLIRELSRPDSPARRLQTSIARPSQDATETVRRPAETFSQTMPWSSVQILPWSSEDDLDPGVPSLQDKTPPAPPLPKDDSLAAEPDAQSGAHRYEKITLLGRGTSGEVWRVHDRTLGRTVAMKLAHPAVVEHDDGLLRFLEEAQVIAQLGHPSIIPVFDIGALDTGHLYFTMTEIEGQPFDVRISEVHQDLGSSGTASVEGKGNLFRLLAVFADVCNAVAYAHQRGVIHRDLKPSNIMVGTFGEVLVVDWGLAKVLTRSKDPAVSRPEEDPLKTARSQGGRMGTMVGTVAGTPSYMAPEQARGAVGEQDERTDIYCLGAILYEILRGVPPVTGRTVASILTRISSGDVLPFSRPCSEVPQDGDWSEQDDAVFVSCNGTPIPQVLGEACKRALAFDPNERFQSVREFLEVIEGWLDGSKKAQLGLALVARAADLHPQTQLLETQASELREQAKALLEDIPLWESEDLKYEGWALQEKATALLAEAASNTIVKEQLLQAALAHKGDLQPAHIDLAEHYLGLHQQAEAAGDSQEARSREQQLRATLQKIVQDNPERPRFQRYLEGHGQVSVVTDPPDPDLAIFRHVSSNRRLVLEPFGDTAAHSLHMKRLPMGSYVARLSKPGYHDAVYPFAIDRGMNWESMRPDGVEVAVQLLPEGDLGPDDCYVPAGWSRLGGDSQTPNSLPHQRVWVDGFVIRRFPVTHAEYLVFLNDLVERGDPDSALLHVPRQQIGEGEGLGAMLYELTESGRYSFSDSEDAVETRQPVTLVTWESARAYAEWLGGETNTPWRLLMEFEWEKAARGVDGRFYPWGDEFDPSRSCMKDSHDDQVKIQVVDSFPTDVSVYGVRGTAGNTRDWCLDQFRDEGPTLADGRLVFPSEAELADTGFKSTRGGSYGNSAARARSADRDWWFPDRAYIGRGFRIGWSVGKPE